MDKLTAKTPLHGTQLSRSGFAMAENNDFGLIRLQVFHRDAASIAAVSDSMQITMPGPGEIAGKGDMHVLWSAPGEWILVVPQHAEEERLSQLRAMLGGIFAVLSPMTDGRVVIQLSGVRLADVLSRGSSLDFHPSVFSRALCVSTKFAGVPVMLARFEAQGTVFLFACRSVAAYLADWLEAAGADC